MTRRQVMAARGGEGVCKCDTPLPTRVRWPTELALLPPGFHTSFASAHWFCSRGPLARCGGGPGHHRRGDRFDGAFQAQRLCPGGAGSCGLRLGSVHLSRRACVVSSTPRETLERPPMGASSNHTESLPAGSLPRRFKENWVGELAAYVLRLWDERDLGAPRLGLFDADRPCPPRPLVPRSQEGPLHRRNRRPPAPH